MSIKSRFPVHKYFGFVFLYVLMLLFSIALSQEQEPLYKNGTYEQNIPSPEEVLGFSLGERPVRYEEVVKYLKTLSRKTPRVKLVEAGMTHENRRLYYALVSSAENMTRLDEIKDKIATLSDPRKLKSGREAQDITSETPAIAWLMYSIHGDELSGVDAGLMMAYQLAAGTDTLSKKLRRELVVGIDPIENPDGRERFLAQMEQWRGLLPNSDAQSIQHTGVWPWGRGNHYLFDLNRDWFILSQPESRARVQALVNWHPQLVVDAHEMGSYETFLFPPPREPFNPNLSPAILKWTNTLSEEQAKAFDQYGWSYYTREWNEEWYPGYGSSLPVYHGAIGILYEQASTEGTSIKRPDGTVLTFRESVHHQFISSVANLTTLANHREEILNDFYGMKKEASAKSKSGAQAYYIVPGGNPSRANRLIGKLLMQNIEIETAEADFQVRDARSYWEAAPAAKKLPKGTFIIRLDQPLRPLINTILEFDPRMTTEFLKSERESLERGEGTRMYEVSAWSLPMAYNVEAYASSTSPGVKTKPVGELPAPIGRVTNPDPAYGFVINYSDDNAITALLKVFESGCKVRIAREPFQIEGNAFSRGSLLLRRNENPPDLPKRIAEIAQTSGAAVYGVNTARSQDGPDLGGGEFELLAPPKIAVLSGPSISLSDFGVIWYLLDHELKYPFSILNNGNFEGFDLRKYNVLILPSASGGTETYQQMFGKKGIEKLKNWVNGGGTLIGIENGAAFLADSATGFSQVKLRRQALKEIALYEAAAEQERQIGKTKIDSLTIWEGKDSTAPKAALSKDAEKDKEDLKALEAEDQQLRLFMPRGAILKVDLDETYWLNFGVGDKVPAILYTSNAYFAKKPVETAGRFARAPGLRMSGLLWPEAKKRWENTAYATREALGNGQIILFAGEPDFRSYFYGTGRMLINSMLLGPGFGTKQPAAR